MSRPSLLEALRRRTLLGDGAMGTELQRAGLEPGAGGELWNLERPDAVLEIHRRYGAAGAEVLLTNTFGASRLGLARHGADDRVREINLAGAALARRALGDTGWVLGDLGPSGGLLQPLGELEPDVVYAAFTEQARALLAGGVDGILVETMTAPEELALAVRAARAAGAPVVIASMAFDRTRVGLRTMMGTAPEAAARAMLAAGADVLGANCGTGLALADFAEVARAYRAVAPGVPLLVRPNAGQPELVGTAVVYHAGPEPMAAQVPALLAQGVRLLGGCCGTTPAHVRAFAAALTRPAAAASTNPAHERA